MRIMTWGRDTPIDKINIINSSFNNFSHDIFNIDKFNALNINNCSFTNFNGQLLGRITYESNMSVNFTKSTVINSTGFFELFNIEANNLNFSKNTFKNINLGWYIKGNFLDFSGNILENITKIEMQCPKIDLTDCIIKNIYPEILDSEHIYGSNLIMECNDIIFKNTQLDKVIINLWETLTCSIEDSSICNSIINDDKFKSFSMQNSNVINSTFPISANTLKLANSNFTNVGSVDFSGTASSEILSCNMINISGIGIISKKVTLKNTKFLNLYVDDFYGISIREFNDLLIDGCEFGNCYSKTDLLYLNGNNVNIKNSSFYDNRVIDAILHTYCKNFSLTGSAISNNIAGLVINHQDTEKKAVTTYFNLYHNILAGNFNPKHENAPYTLIYNYYVIDEENNVIGYYTKINIKENFYGFNMIDEYELKNVPIKEFLIQKSWLNLNAKSIQNNTYQLNFTTNNGKSIVLKDYEFTLINKKTNEKIGNVLVKNGIGEVKLPENLKINDVNIMNRANQIVNKPQAKITITKVGTDYEDFKLIIKLTDKEGNPIKNSDIDINVAEKFKSGPRTLQDSLKTDNNGLCYLVSHISHVKRASNVDKYLFISDKCDFNPIFTNEYYSFTTASLKNIVIKNVPAKVVLKKLTTTYNSNVKMVLKILSKKTNKGVYGQSGYLYVYKGSKLIKKVLVKTNRNGIFYYNPSKLGVGKYKIKFNPTPQYNQVDCSKTTRALTIKKAKTIVKAPKISAKYKQNKIFKVTVKHKISKKVQKGVLVKIKVSGKIFKVKTNKNGIAKLSTKNLSVGTHKVSIRSGDSKYVISKKSSIKIGR